MNRINLEKINLKNIRTISRDKWRKSKGLDKITSEDN